MRFNHLIDYLLYVLIKDKRSVLSNIINRREGWGNKCDRFDVLPSADQRVVSLVVPCGLANENYMKPNTFLNVSKNDDSGNPNFAGRNLNFQ